jgi:hypothetical protein
MRNLFLNSDTPAEILTSVSTLGYKTALLPAHPTLPPAISRHPDSLLFLHNGTVIIDKEYFLKNRELFERTVGKYEIILSDDTLGASYPEDTRLNALVIGDMLFCRTKSISRAILKYADDSGLSVIDTKQGYPACSTLKLSDGAVITADAGLASLYERHGVRVYEISPGGISLPPYEYGFIGGAAVTLDGIVAFFGDARLHPSYKIIEKALRDLSLVPVFLSASPLTDLGGGVVF